jgi:two-component system, OmpR family, alkaline phosphatase synthesis response regulator PhoP
MKTTVLVVEDEQDTAELLKCVLEREGFLVVYAKDGRQATTLIETIRPPSLIVLDMVIPYVSGFELLRVIRRHPDWQTIPVIMLSADHYEPDIQQALREGATTYLVKQPGLHNLIQAIAQVLPPPVPAAPALDQAIIKPATPAARNGRSSVRHQRRSGQGKRKAA